MKATVTFTKPEGATLEDVAGFIDSALSSWGGGLHPEDPMFYSLKLSAIVVHGRKFEPEGSDA